MLPPCPLWDGGGFISSTQKMCVNLLLKKHHWKGTCFHQYLWSIFFNCGLGVQSHNQNTFHGQSSSHSVSHQSRCSRMNFWKKVISIIFVRFKSINLHQIFIQDSVCINNWNSCVGVEYVCPVFYPFCTKYVIRGKSLSFPINFCKSSL